MQLSGKAKISAALQPVAHQLRLLFYSLPVQLSHKDKEAEFWRIVEDGEDVVEVRA